MFIQENAFESVVCKMAAIFSRPQCAKHIAGELGQYFSFGVAKIPAAV